MRLQIVIAQAGIVINLVTLANVTDLYTTAVSIRRVITTYCCK